MISTAITPNPEEASRDPLAPRAARATRFDRPARPLGEQLVDAHIISQAELESALAMQSQRGMRIGELLMELGIVDEETLLPFIEQQLGVPAVRLREGLLDPTAVKVIPRALAERLQVVGMFLVRDTLTVALPDPQNLQKLDEIERLSGYRVNPVFVFAPALARMLKRCYEEDFEVDAVTADFDRSSVELQADITDVSITAIERMVDGSPVINLVNYLILQAIRRAASDIHIEPGRKYTVVRFRIDGQLVEVLRPRRDIHPAVVSRVKVMAKMDIAEQRMPQDGRCQVAVEGKEVDLRVSTLPTVLGEKVVMRVLDRRRLTFNLDRLGFTHDLLTKFKQLLAKPHGLLLVTGPTGSGKTTTLYSALELIKSVHRNIVTVEDPVEYQLELINQVQADKARSLDFAAALRSILRQDPDVIMVGEIRDAETAKVAVQAALTGHLVLSTLHTNDSAGAVTRLMDMGVESYKVAAALVGVVAQRLLRTICPKCRTTYYPTEDQLNMLHYEGDRRRTFSRGAGCRECYDTGFQGRMGIYEVLLMDPTLRGLVVTEASLEQVRDCYREQGGKSLLESGLELAERELTSLDEVARVAFVE